MDMQPKNKFSTIFRSPLFILIISTSSVHCTAGVYKWTDEQGNVHYGSKPVGQNSKSIKLRTAAPSSKPEKRQPVQVKRVIDGDTLVLVDGTRIRLIGIRAPNLVSDKSPELPGAREARDALKRILNKSSNKIMLAYDGGKTDYYGRTLAYAYTPNGQSINEKLLEEGYCFTYFRKNSIRHQTKLLEIEKQARSEKRGIWKLAHYQVKSEKEISNMAKSYRFISGVITFDRKYPNGKRRLKMSDYLTIDVREDVDLRLNNYKGLRITVRGWLRSSNGSNRVTIYNSSRIRTGKNL